MFNLVWTSLFCIFYFHLYQCVCIEINVILFYFILSKFGVGLFQTLSFFSALGIVQFNLMLVIVHIFKNRRTRPKVTQIPFSFLCLRLKLTESLYFKSLVGVTSDQNKGSEIKPRSSETLYDL